MLGIEVSKEKGEKIRLLITDMALLDKHHRIIILEDSIQIPILREPREGELAGLEDAGGKVVEITEIKPRDTFWEPMKDILELLDFPDELAEMGIEMVGWIGLEGEPEYLATNIKDRSRKDAGRDIDPERLKKKLDMADKIMEMQRQLAQDGVMTIFKVGWHNRDTMGEEIAVLIKEMLRS